MNRWHINPRTGVVRECKPKATACSIAAELHFFTKEQAAAQKQALLAEKAVLSDAIDESLQPHGASVSGFLGAFESYASVVEEDARTLASYCTTAQEIGEMLELFSKLNNLYPTEAGKLPKKLSDPRFPLDLVVTITPNIGTRGSQGCPFQELSHSKFCASAMSKSFITLESPLGKLEVNQLAGHLIAVHGFFQGIYSAYRVDPATLCELFGFKKVALR
jgi:hypothetical protein